MAEMGEVLGEPQIEDRWQRFLAVGAAVALAQTEDRETIAQAT